MVRNAYRTADVDFMDIDRTLFVLDQRWALGISTGYLDTSIVAKNNLKGVKFLR
jgi:hypothetical protein